MSFEPSGVEKCAAFWVFDTGVTTQSVFERRRYVPLRPFARGARGRRPPSVGGVVRPLDLLEGRRAFSPAATEAPAASSGFYATPERGAARRKPMLSATSEIETGAGCFTFSGSRRRWLVRLFSWDQRSFGPACPGARVGYDPAFVPSPALASRRWLWGEFGARRRLAHRAVAAEGRPANGLLGGTVTQFGAWFAWLRGPVCAFPPCFSFSLPFFPPPPPFPSPPPPRSADPGLTWLLLFLTMLGRSPVPTAGTPDGPRN